MTATSPVTESLDIALPPGADAKNSDYWDASEDGATYRLIWSHPQPLPDELAREDVRVVVVQYMDGHIATDGDDQPLVYIGGSDYTVANARALAQAIIEAADQADEWAGRGADVANRNLTAAHRATRTAYTTLRTKPGNAGCHLAAALDHLCAATEAALR